MDSHDDDEVQFGGLPFRWPFGQAHRPRVTIAAAALAAGLLIGFFGGRLTAHQAPPKSRSTVPVSTPVVIPQFETDAIAMTGARCAVQVGGNLQLGLEVTNQSPRPVMLRAVSLTFPLGRLRTISSGLGTCGQLPAHQLYSSPALPPGSTEWISATVAVPTGCPQALPVWFRVGYASRGRAGTAVLPGFPDLGSVSFRHCPITPPTFSITIVEPGTGRSSRG